MSKRLFIYLFLLSSTLSAELPNIGEQELASIGERIWKNESGGKVLGLTSWNEGEEFASIGIGHFIWYPVGAKKIFQESFPQLLGFLERQGELLPSFLQAKGACPWTSREEFIADLQGPRLSSLRDFLVKTLALQVLFIVERLKKSIPAIYMRLPAERKERVERQFLRLSSNPQGIFVLIDYLNFKGEGTLPSESYSGKGWGLLHVLEEMEDRGEGKAIEDFVLAAKAVLAERVAHSPIERKEGRWLPGWTNRLNSYLKNVPVPVPE